MAWCWLGFYGFSSVAEEMSNAAGSCAASQAGAPSKCCGTASAPQPPNLVARPPCYHGMACVPSSWAHLTWEGRNLAHNSRILPSRDVKHFVIASAFASWERFTGRPSLAFGFTCPFELRSPSESGWIGFPNLLTFSCSVLQLCLWAKQHFIKAFLLSVPLFVFF